MKNWLKGLGNAVINGAIGAVAPIAITWAQGAASGQPTQMPAGSTVGYMAIGSAILGAVNWWMKSPRQDTTSAKLPQAEEKK